MSVCCVTCTAVQHTLRAHAALACLWICTLPCADVEANHNKAPTVIVSAAKSAAATACGEYVYVIFDTTLQGMCTMSVSGSLSIIP